MDIRDNDSQKVLVLPELKKKHARRDMRDASEGSVLTQIWRNWALRVLKYHNYLSPHAASL